MSAHTLSLSLSLSLSLTHTHTHTHTHTNTHTHTHQAPLFMMVLYLTLMEMYLHFFGQSAVRSEFFFCEKQFKQSKQRNRHVKICLQFFDESDVSCWCFLDVFFVCCSVFDGDCASVFLNNVFFSGNVPQLLWSRRWSPWGKTLSHIYTHIHTLTHTHTHTHTHVHACTLAIFKVLSVAFFTWHFAMCFWFFSSRNFHLTSLCEKNVRCEVSLWGFFFWIVSFWRCMGWLRLVGSLKL